MDYKRRDFIEKVILIGSGAALSACSRPAVSGAETNASVAATAVSLVSYPVTSAETAIKAVIADTSYPPGTADRYCVNAKPGTTDMTLALQTAINYAKYTRGTVTYGQTGTYLVTSALDCTESTADKVGTSFKITNVGPQMPGFSAGSQGSIHAMHQEIAVFDCSGTCGITFENVTVSTDPSDSPQTCWFRARNASGGSVSQTFFNCRVDGLFRVAVDYNYGSEGSDWVGCYLFNQSTFPGTKVCYITSNNERLNLKSKFIEIAKGPVSCIDHKYIGGQYANTSGLADSDVWYLEGGVAALKILAPWACCFNRHTLVGGRSIIYADTTSGAPSMCTVMGLQVEHSGHEASQQKYGIYFGDAAATIVGWTVIGGTWQCQTNYIAAGSAVTIANSFFSHSNEIYDKGINIPGTLERCVVEGILAVNIGTSVSNRLTTIGTNLVVKKHVNDIVFDIGTGGITASGPISSGGRTL